MRSTPFKSNCEIDEYLARDTVQCLECGRSFKNLGQHVRVHGYSPDDYRDKWAIPRGRALAGQVTRNILSQQMIDAREQGLINNDHLADAAKNIDYPQRAKKVGASTLEHKNWLAENSPWDANKIKPGGKKSDGRDADRAREYQRAFRAMKAGNVELMARYRAKHER